MASKSSLVSFKLIIIITIIRTLIKKKTSNIFDFLKWRKKQQQITTVNNLNQISVQPARTNLAMIPSTQQLLSDRWWYTESVRLETLHVVVSRYTVKTRRLNQINE